MGLIVFCIFMLGYVGALFALRKRANPLLGFALGGGLGVLGLIIIAAIPTPAAGAS